MSKRSLHWSGFCGVAALGVFLALQHRFTTQERRPSIEPAQPRAIQNLDNDIDRAKTRDVKVAAVVENSDGPVKSHSKGSFEETGAHMIGEKAGQPELGDHSEIPKYWLRTTVNDGYTFTTENQIVHSGSHSAMLNSLVGDGSAVHQISIFQACSALNFRGKRVQFRIYLYGTQGFGKSDIWLRVDDPLQVGALVRAPVQSYDAEWIAASVVIDVPATAATLIYGVILEGPGPLWMDSASLGIVDEAGNAELLTDGQTSSAPAIDYGPAPRAPRNLDFEEFESE